MNPFRDLLDHIISSSGAHVLYTAGLVLAGFGAGGLLPRPDPNPAFVIFASITTAGGLGTLVLGLAAWLAALGDRHDVVRQRVRRGSRWLVVSIVALIRAPLVAEW